MSVGLQLILSTALVAVPPGCSWAHPGANPFRGDPVRVLADFHLAAPTRRKLGALMAARRPTDVVTITRDDIVGAHRYGELREMHSGGGRTCHGSVDRSAWSAQRREGARVYCADEACVIVPRICNNVALVSRKPDGTTARDDPPIDIEPAAGPPAAGAPPESHPDAAPPLDFMAPPDIIGALPGAPDSPGGSDRDDHPIIGLPTGGIPTGGDVPACCALVPVGPGMPPVGAPATVAEAPGWTLLILGSVVVWRARGRGRQARSRSGCACGGQGEANQAATIAASTPEMAAGFQRGA